MGQDYKARKLVLDAMNDAITLTGIKEKSAVVTWAICLLTERGQIAQCGGQEEAVEIAVGLQLQKGKRANEYRER